MTMMKKERNNYFISFVAGAFLGFLLCFNFSPDYEDIYKNSKEYKSIQNQVDSINVLKNDYEKNYSDLVNSIDSMRCSELSERFKQIYGFSPYDLFRGYGEGSCD